MAPIVTIAAIVALVLLGLIVAFQLALAFGAPWGSAAWGGQYPGVLPTRLRVASAVAALVVYPFIALLVLSAAGWVEVPWLDELGSLPMWILAGLLALGALANFASRSPHERIWGPVALAIAVCCAVLAIGDAEPLAQPTRLVRPTAGEVRPDYLADGTPVWVVGHDGGAAGVLSGFDTHTPFNIGKILWWCRSAEAFENPEHGSKYDEFGFRIGGPAPTGLPAHAAVVDGNWLLVGARGAPPPPSEPATGPPDHEREWCTPPGRPIVYHTFDGWPAWDSPTAAIASEPDSWILLNGELVADAGEVWLCSFRGCADRAFVAGVPAPTDPDMEFGPLFGERFIARVRDGALVNLTRVMPEGP
jgi:hypothetical protein